MALTKLVTTNRPPSTFSSADKQPVTVGEFNRLVDEIQDGGETIDGPITTTGVITTTNDTESTSKDTGSIITEGGVGIEKSLNTGLSITAGTTVTVGTNLLMVKEVNHTIQVSNTTTADTAGGNLSLTSGKGVGVGAGGGVTLSGAQGGATGAGGSLILSSGQGGATSGNSGAVSLTSASSPTSGNTGALSITSGSAVSGVAGDVLISTGSQTSTTVKAAIRLSKALIRVPESSSVASGGTITANQLVGGLITATGGVGNWTLPAAADIVTSLGGSVIAGTNFEFVFNAEAMTATDVATLVVGAGMTVASAPAITGGGALTVAQDTQATAGFRVVFNTTTTCKIYRIW